MFTEILCRVLQIAVFVIIGWVILSYVVNYGRLPYGHPVRRVFDILERVIQPVLQPIRAVVPAVRVGSGALDLSPIILIFGIWILQMIFC